MRTKKAEQAQAPTQSTKTKVQAFRNEKKKVFVIYPGGIVKKMTGRIEKTEVLLELKYAEAGKYAENCEAKTAKLPNNQLFDIEI